MPAPGCCHHPPRLRPHPPSRTSVARSKQSSRGARGQWKPPCSCQAHGQGSHRLDQRSSAGPQLSSAGNLSDGTDQSCDASASVSLSVKVLIESMVPECWSPSCRQGLPQQSTDTSTSTDEVTWCPASEVWDSLSFRGGDVCNADHSSCFSGVLFRAKLEMSNPRVVPRLFHVTMRSRNLGPPSSCLPMWSMDMSCKLAKIWRTSPQTLPLTHQRRSESNSQHSMCTVTKSLPGTQTLSRS